MRTMTVFFNASKREVWCGLGLEKGINPLGLACTVDYAYFLEGVAN
jgi:hypothetical protein